MKMKGGTDLVLSICYYCWFCCSLLQLGILLAFALGTVSVGRSDTNEVCGNNTYQPPRDTPQFADWNHTISNQLFYYLLGQAVLSLAILLLTLAGMYF